jgi:hypothetical protein
MHDFRLLRSLVMTVLVLLGAGLVACASSGSAPAPAAAKPPAASGATVPGAPAPGTLAYDQSVFHDLLEGHGSMRRSVSEIEGGIEATTESDDPAVAALLADHVVAMKRRIENGGRVRQWDPLYIAMFDHAEAIHLDIQRTAKGVRVRETSTDPRVVALIRSHAGVVSGFAAYGVEESAKEHPVPEAAKR